MNGFIYKIIAITFVILSTIFSPIFATTTQTQDETKIYNTQQGCMSCHQGQIIQPEYHLKKNKKHSK
jgi:nitrate/TMAO reductase-like tetraheme cytochrome c subunit